MGKLNHLKHFLSPSMNAFILSFTHHLFNSIVMYQTPDLNNQNSGTETSIIKKSEKAWCTITIGKKKKWNIYSMSHSHLRAYFYGTLLFWTLPFLKILPPCIVLVTLPHCLPNRMLKISLHVYEYGDRWKSGIGKGLRSQQGRRGWDTERSADGYTLPCGEQMASGRCRAAQGSAPLPCGNRGHRRGEWERRVICTRTAAAQRWTAETDTIP